MHSPTLQLTFVIIGAGGHASVVAATLRAMDAAICGFTDRDPALAGSLVMGAPILGDDSALDTIDIASVQFANGLGIQPKVRGLETPDPGTNLRRRVFEALSSRAFLLSAGFSPVRRNREHSRDWQRRTGDGWCGRAIAHRHSRERHRQQLGFDRSRLQHWRALVYRTRRDTVRRCAGWHGYLNRGRRHYSAGVSIGENAVISAGGVIRRDVKDHQFAVS